VAIFVTNVAFFNILIAIVGDTYERIIENKERERLKEEVKIIQEY
jgi:hypothetical protein